MSLIDGFFRAIFAIQDLVHPVKPARYRPDPALLGVKPDPDSCYIEMSDGARLFYRSWLPERPGCVMACFHGMGAYGGHFRVIGEYLKPRNVAVYAFDLRGHGLSDGPRGDFTRVDLITDDLDGVARFLKRQHPGLPVFFLGESLAASIVLKYAVERPSLLSGIILSSVEIKPSVTPSLSEILRYLPYVLWDSHSNIIEMGERERLVSRDPEHFPQTQGDPLRTERFSVRTVVEAHALIQEWPELARRLSVPCLILQGGGDLLTDPQGAKDLLKAIPEPDKELALFPGAYHGLFYDPDTPKVLDTVARWLDGHACAVRRTMPV